MARYATQEELFECPDCIVRFALRECEVIGTNPDKPLYLCPSCEDYFVRPDILNTAQGPQQHAMWGQKSLWHQPTISDSTAAGILGLI